MLLDPSVSPGVRQFMGDEGSCMPNSKPFLVIVLHALFPLFGYFINTTAYDCGRQKPSSPSTKELHALANSRQNSTIQSFDFNRKLRGPLKGLKPSFAKKSEADGRSNQVPTYLSHLLHLYSHKEIYYHLHLFYLGWGSFWIKKYTQGLLAQEGTVQTQVYPFHRQQLGHSFSSKFVILFRRSPIPEMTLLPTDVHNSRFFGFLQIKNWKMVVRMAEPAPK